METQSSGRQTRIDAYKLIGYKVWTNGQLHVQCLSGVKGFDHVTNCSSYPNAPQKMILYFLNTYMHDMYTIHIGTHRFRRKVGS